MTRSIYPCFFSSFEYAETGLKESWWLVPEGLPMLPSDNKSGILCHKGRNLEPAHCTGPGERLQPPDCRPQAASSEPWEGFYCPWPELRQHHPSPGHLRISPDATQRWSSWGSYRLHTHIFPSSLGACTGWNKLSTSPADASVDKSSQRCQQALRGAMIDSIYQLTVMSHSCSHLLWQTTLTGNHAEQNEHFCLSCNREQLRPACCLSHPPPPTQEKHNPVENGSFYNKWKAKLSDFKVNP